VETKRAFLAAESQDVHTSVDWEIITFWASGDGTGDVVLTSKSGNVNLVADGAVTVPRGIAVTIPVSPETRLRATSSGGDVVLNMVVNPMPFTRRTLEALWQFVEVGLGCLFGGRR
jgi:hypothetical protein